jgi:bifunctional UDP-N-acetylglucosamine pyrophosphorylase/glucosamine-1-phosphate N-acetyltransferase
MASVSNGGDSPSLCAVVLAAGEGKRMHTQRAKVLHEACGRRLIDHVLAAVEPLAPAPLVVVVGHLRAQVETHLAGRGVSLAIQEPPLGTGDAVARALPLLPVTGDVLVLSGDAPLVTTTTLEALLELRRSAATAAALATAVVPEAGEYGRIVRNGAGDVVAIVEARDASEEQRTIREVNAGTYAFEVGALKTAVGALQRGNAQGEYYLTDVVEILAANGMRIAGLALADWTEVVGVNSRAELAEAHRLLNARVICTLQRAGATVLDPATTWVDCDCTVGRDTVLEAGVHLRRGCVIGGRCRIGAHAVLEGVALPEGAIVPPLTYRRGREDSCVKR